MSERQMANQQKTCAAPQKTVICISGLAGTGKSTLSKKLAEKYRLRYFSGGDVLKELAKKEGYDVSVRGWWESPEGLKFLNKRVSS
jgi:cytidylate kinase